jgi:hypothetical protein
MWKSTYGRYGHYVDFSLMGPSWCCIIYLLNYARDQGDRNEPKKIWNKICKKFITHFTIPMWSERMWDQMVYCVMLHSAKRWLVFDNCLRGFP